MHRRRFLAAMAACSAALPLSGMLPGMPRAQDAGAGSWPRRIAHEGGTLELAAPPRRIVSTSPSLTGTLLAIGAPVAATAAATVGPLTDEQGFFRQWSEVAHERGVEVLYPQLTFDIEAVMLADPDLVVVAATGGDSAIAFVPELEAFGYPVMVLDYGMNSWETLAERLGEATGQEAAAAGVIADFRDRARAAGAEIAHPAGTVSIVAYNFFGSYGVSKPQSAQARVLSEMGFEVTGLPEAMQGLVTRSAEFDFISRENLSAALTGDTIFMLSADAEDVAAFMADPVMANHPAVRSGWVYPLGRTSFRMDYYSGLEMVGMIRAALAQ